ncbi:HAD-IA family hydrolase [Thalassotalea maritima]|uniref:HAD-IA family hydrolase n=1 Tax=Thalassotalea maritima TaxID=3242416 RepID=UPI003527E421
MRFYKKLAKFKAISFDLDDTLYDNHPIISNAERALQNFLEQQVPESANLGRQFWYQHRQACLRQNPHLCHDVSALRLAYMQSGMYALGYNQTTAKQLANAAFEHFLSHRNNLQVPSSVTQLLARLAECFPLVAISNGNVGIAEIGIKDYFQECFFAGAGNLQKPENDMFYKAAASLHIKPSEMLHVGDCTHADIYGALSAGCQTVWVNNNEFGIRKKPLKVLPHAEFDCVEQLALLLPSS